MAIVFPAEVIATEPTRLLAIDPGTTESAWALYELARPGEEVGTPLDKAKEDNASVLKRIDDLVIHRVVIEKVASYGMRVGEEVFETVFWTGRFAERVAARGLSCERMTRVKVKTTLCHASNASDSEVRQRLIDLYGPGKEKAVGLKKTPGPLYGYTEDRIQALALAVTWNMQLRGA